MSAQPTETHEDEQTTDPQVRDRLMAACDNAGDLATHVIRQRVIDNARTGYAEFMARKGL